MKFVYQENNVTYEISQDEVYSILMQNGNIYSFANNRCSRVSYILVNGTIKEYFYTDLNIQKRYIPSVLQIYDNGRRKNISVRICNKLRAGMTIENLKEIIDKSVTDDIDAHYTEMRPYLSKRPLYNFKDLKNEGLISCELPLISKYANVDFIKKNYSTIINYTITDIKNSKVFKKYEIPFNFFKVGKATLRKDDVLDIIFELKIKEEPA